MLVNGDIKSIYDKIIDEESRFIFANRFMYSMTGDMSYIRNVVRTVHVGGGIVRRLCKNDKPIGIFGAGAMGCHVTEVFQGAACIVCFIDNNKRGEEYGLPIITLEEFLIQYPDGIIVIATTRFEKEIEKQLVENGISKDRICNLGKAYLELNRRQYFDLDEFKINEREIFVDGGCYDGQSALNFNNLCKRKNKKAYIYAWEPDPHNLEKARENLKGLDVKFVDKGLWQQLDILKFSTRGTGSTITDYGDLVVPVDSIDNVCKEVSFIKMDIEGSEYRALLGAKKTIKKYTPKLAICVYHRPEDIWEIPRLIMSISESYNFMLRHYSFSHNETVLYGIPI